MSHPFQLVVFDVGSVLVRCGRSLADDIVQAGFPLDPAWLRQFEARLRSLPRRSTGDIENESFLPRFAEASEGVFTLDDARRISDASLLDEYPGLVTIFDRLDAAGLDTAVLSNANDAEWARLFPGHGEPEFPTMLRVHHRFASYQLRVLKPDRGAFQAVERQTGYSAHRILYFDDREENVAAARNLGWTAEHINHTGDTVAQIIAWLDHYGIIDA